ncbi:hypothetical protein ACRAWD_09490 [Caulobacter segnis]
MKTPNIGKGAGWARYAVKASGWGRALTLSITLCRRPKGAGDPLFHHQAAGPGDGGSRCRFSTTCAVVRRPGRPGLKPRPQRHDL